MAGLPDVNSDSKGRSSPGNVGLLGAGFPGAGFAATTGGFPAEGAGLAPGFDFIDAPQNGQSTASSSRTD